MAWDAVENRRYAIGLRTNVIWRVVALDMAS